MKLYVAMVNDRHEDPAAHVFTTAGQAIDFARQHYTDNVPDDLDEQERADAAIGEHEPPEEWLYHATYSTEGDSVWVVETDLKGSAVRPATGLDAEHAAELVFTALGAVSACWSELEDAGEFESSRAAAIGRDLLGQLGYAVPPGYVGRQVEPTDADDPYAGLSEAEQHAAVVSASGGPAVLTPVLLSRRSPYEREQYLVDKERERREAGQPTDIITAVREVLAVEDRQIVAGLGQWARRIVDSFCSEYRRELGELPSAIAQGLIVEATVAYLYGYGLVRPTEPGEAGLHPLEWRVAIPRHLHPDMAGAVAAYDRMVAAYDRMVAAMQIRDGRQPLRPGEDGQVIEHSHDHPHDHHHG